MAAFVAPGREVALALGVDLEAAGLRLVATPRHADVLVLFGPIPAGLESAVELTYAQMPRPRARLAVPATATQAEVQADVARLTTLFAESAWAEHADMDHPAVDHSDLDHGGGGHDMSGMDMDMDHMAMSGGGVMSMVMMTKDLPRSADGLPMEWLDVPFGPLFPGLPGGLGLTLTLDGDTVAAARIEPGVLSRGLEATWPGTVEGFAERVAALDPLSPVAYRVLAERALGATLPGGRIAALERERATSHLNWIAAFGFLLGDRWLETCAVTLHRQLARARDVAALRRIRDDVGAMVRTALLRVRLNGVGQIEHLVDLDGPVARAVGHIRDVRLDEPAYRELGFKPVVAAGNDAFARLQVRISEIEQSIDLLMATSGDNTSAGPIRMSENGVGDAAIETPRGAARLRIEVRAGHVVRADLSTPSQGLVDLVSAVAEGRELADALIGLASLDLSPWEVDR